MGALKTYYTHFHSFLYVDLKRRNTSESVAGQITAANRFRLFSSGQRLPDVSIHITVQGAYDSNPDSLPQARYRYNPMSAIWDTTNNYYYAKMDGNSLDSPGEKYKFFNNDTITIT